MRTYLCTGIALVLAVAFHPLLAKGQEPEKRDDGRVVKTETSTKKIPFVVRYLPDRNVGAGRIVPGQDDNSGHEGVETTVVTFVYKDGKLVSKTSETKVTKQPVDVIYKVGMEGYGGVSRGSYTRGKVIEVEATAYMANEGRLNPGSNTATGRRAEYGIVAVDPKVIPLNSILYVEGYGLAIAADTGGAIKGKRIDVCVESRREMHDWGRKKVVVHIIKEEKKQAASEDGHEFKAYPVATPGSLDAVDGLDGGQDDTHEHDPASTPGLTAEEAARLKNGGSKPAESAKPADTGNPKPNTPKATEPKARRYPRDVEIKRSDVIVRNKPTSDADRVDTVQSGETVTIWDNVRGWYRVKTEHGKAGYIRADLVDSGTTVASRTIKVGHDNVIVREKATVDSSRVGMAQQGESLTVLGEKNGWYRVRLSGGETGYIRGDLLGEGDSKSIKYKVLRSEVLVRSKPTTKSDRVDSLKKGETVIVIGEDSGWYKIKLASGKTGYVRGDLLGRSGHKSSKN